MKAALARLRERLTFANVTAATALFVALGGTSYAAITLPENSVGTREIRTGGVGAAELHTDSVRAKEIKDGEVGSAEIAKDAVTTDQIKDGTVAMKDLDAATQGAIGAGPFRADVNAGGGLDGGNAKGVAHSGPGVYNVDFGSDVSKCTAVTSLANVDAANVGGATASPGSTASTVTVHTYKPATTAGGAPTAADLPFHLIVAC